MKREITSPSYYQGDTVIDFAATTVPWDFTADKDIKFATTNDLNASALEECDLTFLILENLTSQFATNVFQIFIDPGLDDVAWHYDISFIGQTATSGLDIIPYVTHVPAASADSQAWQMLSHEQASVSDGNVVMRAKGTVIRRKKGVAEDDKNLAFGILIFNPGTVARIVEGMGNISVHPNTLPLTVADPGL